MKNKWHNTKTGTSQPVYQMEQSASMQYWKERYLWLLEKYNKVLEKSVRSSFEKRYLNIKL